MTTSRQFNPLLVIFALFIAAPVASVPYARAATPPEGGTAAGGVVHQSGNCSAARPEDELCLLGAARPNRTGPVGHFPRTSSHCTRFAGHTRDPARQV